MIGRRARGLDLHGAHERLLAAFRDEAGHRQSRPGIDATSGEPNWVLAERQRMLTEVNRIRRSAGADPVTLRDIEDAERPAVGHSDYASKFAFYCAELALRA